MAKLGNLTSRVLVALVAVPILVFIIYRQRPEPLWFLVYLGAALAMYEFFAMTLGDKTDRWASLIAGMATTASLYWLQSDALLSALDAPPRLYASGPLISLVLAVLPICLYYLFRFGDMATVAPRIAYSITGIVYVGVLMSFVALIKRDFGVVGAHMVIFVLVVTWLGDTGAYFAGRFLGKSKLYPAVSPKKTWAGAFGGVAASALGAAGIKMGLLASVPQIGWLDVMLLAVPGAILGQMGDLVESLFKRSVGVKDSGAILPGHGGILDRVDAVLFMAPYVYLYMSIAVDPALFQS